ncbi:MAG: hypothetical protein K0V04_27555 [Deltaproteobacteria bacterium]|nr:hypothetical protein [Deltaproteobacteria bacterium]
MAAWIWAFALLSSVEPPGVAPPATTPSIVVEGACDQPQDLRERLDAIVSSPDAAVEHVQLQAIRDAEIWIGQLRFEVDGIAHRRALSAESCAALYEASALVIALTVQPAEPSPEPSPEPPDGDEPDATVPAPDEALPLPEDPEPEDPEPEPTTDDTEPTVPERPADETSQWLRIRGRLGGGVGVGMLRPVQPVVVGGVAVRGSRWAAGIDAYYLPPMSATLAPGARAVVQMAAVSMRGCPVWRWLDERLVLPVCGAIAVGPAWGRGEGPAITARRGRDVWVAAMAGPRLQLRAPWGADLWIAAELVVPLFRPQFVLDDIGPACCESALGGVFSVGGGFSGPRERIRFGRDTQ